ncbi:MAG TPA: helix-turn-helix domain-containing protein [Actinomycetota bacterium]|nr:helix-turn-helix domain-containing protein [Actinomycetota bacterium]
MQDRYLSVKEVADYLGFSPLWVYRHVRELRGSKLGGRWRFSREDIDHYVERRRGAGRTR